MFGLFRCQACCNAVERLAILEAFVTDLEVQIRSLKAETSKRFDEEHQWSASRRNDIKVDCEKRIREQEARLTVARNTLGSRIESCHVATLSVANRLQHDIDDFKERIAAACKNPIPEAVDTEP